MMIRVRVSRGDGRMTLDIDGHSGAGPKGSDVVCAAISAITETALLGLWEVARQHPAHVQVEITDDERSEHHEPDTGSQ